MTLRWNPQINDYEDVPGGYEGTPALMRQPVPTLYSDPYAGLSDQDASSQYLDKMMKESFKNQSLHVPVGRSLARVDIPSYSMSPENQKAWDEERYRNREILRLMMQEKKDYEEQQRNRAAFAEWQATGGAKGYNPTAQNATSFAPNTPGRGYVDPFLQQSISPKTGEANWMERRITSAEPPAGYTPPDRMFDEKGQPDYNAWDEKTASLRDIQVPWRGKDIRSSPISGGRLPINFQGGENLEFIDPATNKYISPAQVVAAWQAGSRTPMPQAYPSQSAGDYTPQGIFDPKQQYFSQDLAAKLEEAQQPGEKGAANRKEIPLSAGDQTILSAVLGNLKGPDGQPILDKPAVAQYLQLYMKNPEAFPDALLYQKGMEKWRGIPRPTPQPSGLQTPLAGPPQPPGAATATAQPAATAATGLAEGENALYQALARFAGGATIGGNAPIDWYKPVIHPSRYGADYLNPKISDFFRWLRTNQAG